jgi:hypothetical protein
MRRCSTLQSAHNPVRGQPDPFGALSEALPAAEVLTTLIAAVPEDAESAPPDEEREHAARVVEANMRREGSLVIALER